MSERRGRDQGEGHILSISLDSSIADPTSEAYVRQRAYASHFASYTVVTKTENRESETIEEGPLRVLSANSASRYRFLLDSYRLGVSIGDVDVVTTQDPFALGLVGLALARRLDARLHVQVHTDFLENDTWRRESLDHHIYDRLGRFVLPRANAIRVGTEYEADKVRKFVGEEIPVHVAPVKMEFDDLVPTTLNESELRDRLDIGDRPVVMFAGRFVPAKDLERWMRVAAEVRRRTATDPVFLLVGDGPEREMVEFEAAKRSLSDDSRLTGWVDRETLGEYYNLADVFLITSAYEGTSRVVIEAGMNGTPVVATPFAGAHDNIVNGETGIVVNDTDSLADGVAKLINNPDARYSMGQEARGFLETKFRNRSFTEEYVDFLQPR